MALAPAAASRERWSADVALDMADAWGESGHRVVVADCVLEHPTLHRNAGLQNGEGVADAALFGASVSRIAQPVPGRSFFFVSAGSPAGDPDSVVTSARWGRLQDGFRDAGVTFVIFLREGCVGEAMLIDGADDVVVLTESSERVPRSAREAAGKVRLLVGVDGADQGVPAAEPETGADEASADSDEDDGWETPAHPGSPDSPDTGWDDPALAGLGNWGAAGSEDDDADADAEDAAMDFAAAPADADPNPPHEPETVQGASAVHAPEAEAGHPAATVPSVNRRGRRGGSDPDATRKLLWVGLAVLILIVLVVLGALR
ncbi:MAG: hypothetical protein WEA34_08995 [Gemmatimonadota bacterium]